MIQNLSQFQVGCVAGSGRNDWPSLEMNGSFEERKEVACATCARLDFLEHMQEVFLFQADEKNELTEELKGSDQSDSDTGNKNLSQQPLRIKDAERVNKLLCVRRYAKRWPLIPKEELYASSVAHPMFPNMKWLVHSRAVPLRSKTFGDKGTDTTEPGSAGVGDPRKTSYLRQLCASKLCRKHPSMPGPALANDMWIGRLPPAFADLTPCEETLLSLGRPCYRKILLGKKGMPEDELQKGLAGNSVFLAQPTAGVPAMELPPGPACLSDHLVIAFAGQSTTDLSKARWAMARKSKYLAAARYRKQVCPAFQDVAIRDNISENILPEEGVPFSLQSCTVPLPELTDVKQHFPGLAGSDQHLLQTEANEVSEQDSGSDAQAEEESKTINEPIIALSTAADHDSTLMFSVFQEKMKLLQEEAMRVASAEKQQLLGCDGLQTSCVDEGGRQICRKIVLDLQDTAQRLHGEARIRIEEAIRESDNHQTADPAALAAPTNEPLSWYKAATWPASFAQFIYGDGAPALARDKDLLFEEVFEFLLNRQELSYKVPGETTPFQPPGPNRFADPALICIFADVRRRLSLLTSTRAVVNRPGFQADLQTIANATANDFF